MGTTHSKQPPLDPAEVLQQVSRCISGKGRDLRVDVEGIDQVTVRMKSSSLPISPNEQAWFEQIGVTKEMASKARRQSDIELKKIARLSPKELLRKAEQLLSKGERLHGRVKAQNRLRMLYVQRFDNGKICKKPLAQLFEHPILIQPTHKAQQSASQDLSADSGSQSGRTDQADASAKKPRNDAAAAAASAAASSHSSSSPSNAPSALLPSIPHTSAAVAMANKTTSNVRQFLKSSEVSSHRLGISGAWSALFGFGIGFLFRMISYRFPWTEKWLNNKWFMRTLAAVSLGACLAIPWLGGVSFVACLLTVLINAISGILSSFLGDWLARKVIQSKWFQATKCTWGLRHLHPPGSEPVVDVGPDWAPVGPEPPVHVEHELAGPEVPVHVEPEPSGSEAMAAAHVHGEGGFLHVGLCSICGDENPILDAFVHSVPANHFDALGAMTKVHHAHMSCGPCAAGWTRQQLESDEVIERPDSVQMRCIICRDASLHFRLLNAEELGARECPQCILTGQCSHPVDEQPCGHTNQLFIYTGNADSGIHLQALCCSQQHAPIGMPAVAMLK